MGLFRPLRTDLAPNLRTSDVANGPDFGVWSERMESCRHAVLTALPLAPRRLRCTVCHLTISEDELDGASCPECYEARGERNDDFEVIEADSTVVKYRCEACGVVVAP